MERLRAETRSPVRARRNARQTGRPQAGRSHLYAVESEVAQTTEADAVIPKLLQNQKALAQGQPQAPRRRAPKNEALTVCVCSGTKINDLLRAQRNHRLDATGSARRDPAGEKRDPRQTQGHRHKGDRIGSTHAVKHALHHARTAKSNN